MSAGLEVFLAREFIVDLCRILIGVLRPVLEFPTYHNSALSICEFRPRIAFIKRRPGSSGKVLAPRSRGRSFKSRHGLTTSLWTKVTESVTISHWDSSEE